MKVLILAGTAEARALCDALHEIRGIDPLSSLAGATSVPAAYRGHVRTGGFGGPEGLARFLAGAGTDAIVDATHPFARTMQANAVAAAAATRTPLLRLERPGWPWEPSWRPARSVPEAIASLPPGAVAFLAAGRSAASDLPDRADIALVMRAIEPPEAPLAGNVRLILGPPGPTPDAEAALFRSEGVTHLIAKDSGGPAGAKLEAARLLGLRVLMIPRPPPAGAPTVATVALALDWVRSRAPH